MLKQAPNKKNERIRYPVVPEIERVNYYNNTVFHRAKCLRHTDGQTYRRTYTKRIIETALLFKNVQQYPNGFDLEARYRN